MNKSQALGMAGIFALIAASTSSVRAADVPISGYDIIDAVISGHGGWAHTYDGTITPGAAFIHNGLSGTLAAYGGVGNGTLTDGVIGGSISNTQLFVPAPGATDNTAIDPEIAFTLPYGYSIETIDIYGGDIPSNGIPGAITSVTVQLLKTDFTLTAPVAFATTPFGTVMSTLGVPVNDRIGLTGSSLENIAAFAVFLSGFDTPGAGGGIPNTEGGWFSITEVKMTGTQAPVVPIPGAVWLFGTALAGLAGVGAVKRKNAKSG